MLYVCCYSGVINYSNELCCTDIRKLFTSLDIEYSVRSGRNKNTDTHTTQMDEYANKSINIMVAFTKRIEGRSMCVVWFVFMWMR